MQNAHKTRHNRLTVSGEALMLCFLFRKICKAEIDICLVELVLVVLIEPVYKQTADNAADCTDNKAADDIGRVVNAKINSRHSHEYRKEKR